MISDQISVFEKETAQIESIPVLSFSDSVLSAAELDALTIPAREPIAGTWWYEGALGFLFGPRGLGKTWLAVHLARCIAEGRNCGPWKIPKAHRVLYIDGEMALDALRERDRALADLKDAPIDYLSHERHFAKVGHGLNLTSVEAQEAITTLCREKRYKVIFLDNLSCLFSGIRENDADDWEAVLPWLLNLRREGIAVCIVHHAGRNGATMRGTSRREDAAFWVMRLDAPNAADEFPGAQFVSRFTKFREGDESERGPWEWTFATIGGKTSVRYKLLESYEMFLQLVGNGLDSCTDIAAEMGISKGTVSKWAKRAASERRMVVENGRYRSLDP